MIRGKNKVPKKKKKIYTVIYRVWLQLKPKSFGVDPQRLNLHQKFPFDSSVAPFLSCLKCANVELFSCKQNSDFLWNYSKSWENTLTPERTSIISAVQQTNQKDFFVTCRPPASVWRRFMHCWFNGLLPERFWRLLSEKHPWKEDEFCKNVHMSCLLNLKWSVQIWPGSRQPISSHGLLAWMLHTYSDEILRDTSKGSPYFCRRKT